MKYLKTMTILPSIEISESQNTGVIDVSDLEEIKIKIVASGKSGTNPTLDFTIKDSEDGSTFDTHTAVSQITANGTTIVRLDKFTRFLRIDGVLGGSDTPKFTAVITAVGIRIAV
jgi:hypothetical protein